MIKIQYLAHACILINTGEHEIIIDPFLSENEDAPLSADDINAKFIALTHGHADHFGDTEYIAKKNDATVIAVAELARYSAELGLNVHAMHIGGMYEFPFGKLKFTIAHHGSSAPDGTYLGNPAGIIIKTNGKTIYHAGDTALTYDMKLLSEQFDVDIMFVPIGDNFTMGINDAVKAVQFVDPKFAVPIHYNTFPQIKANPEEFIDKLKAVGKLGKVMEFGEIIEV